MASRFSAGRGASGRQTSKRTRATGSRGQSNTRPSSRGGAKNMTISNTKKKKKKNGGY